MLKGFAFGEWLPDLAPSGTVTVATNAKPIANGYAPVPGFQAVTDTDTRFFEVAAGIDFVTSAGDYGF